jgi:hypothetical protein
MVPCNDRGSAGNSSSAACERSGTACGVSHLSRAAAQVGGKLPGDRLLPARVAPAGGEAGAMGSAGQGERAERSGPAGSAAGGMADARRGTLFVLEDDPPPARPRWFCHWDGAPAPGFDSAAREAYERARMRWVQEHVPELAGCEPAHECVIQLPGGGRQVEFEELDLSGAVCGARCQGSGTSGFGSAGQALAEASGLAVDDRWITTVGAALAPSSCARAARRPASSPGCPACQPTYGRFVLTGCGLKTARTAG